jgi:hypothetical protein
VHTSITRFSRVSLQGLRAAQDGYSSPKVQITHF